MIFNTVTRETFFGIIDSKSPVMSCVNTGPLEDTIVFSKDGITIGEVVYRYNTTKTNAVKVYRINKEAIDANR